MPDATPAPTPVANASLFDPDLIFPVLADPVRRGLLLAVARNGGQPASVLKDGVGRRLDATLKHLKAMLDARLLVATPDRVDKRRMLYALAPAVPFVKTETGAVIDFGFVMLRL